MNKLLSIKSILPIFSLLVLTVQLAMAEKLVTPAPNGIRIPEGYKQNSGS